MDVQRAGTLDPGPVVLLTVMSQPVRGLDDSSPLTYATRNATMWMFVIRRLIQMVFTLWIISMVTFIAIQLPPGDFLTRKIQLLEQRGSQVNLESAQRLRRHYGLDKSYAQQYWLWISRFVKGDLGQSFEHERPVSDLMGERLALTVALGLSVLCFTWMTAVPLGVFAAMRKYTWPDHLLTFLGFIGLATPSFLLALVVLVFLVFYTNNASVGGLFSTEFRDAPWSLGKFGDFLRHVWLPVLLVGSAGTATLMRIMRGSLLDVLSQEFVVAARARGLSRRRVVLKHALTVAVNPMISIAGMQLPEIIGGEILVAIVLNLPTTGPLFIQALRQQDMYLAGALLMFMAILLVVGNFLADLALAFTDNTRRRRRLTTLVLKRIHIFFSLSPA